MNTYGLLGKELSHSFSKHYFSEKFEKQRIDAVYENFALRGISAFPQFLKEHPEICGLNVTIPYKKSIIYFIDELDAEAEAVGAVNVVKFQGDTLKGYNTDIYGFEQSLKPLLHPDVANALILGTGGASLAVAYVLKKLGIAFRFVSRTPAEDMYSYSQITNDICNQNQLIINASPVGTAGTAYQNEVLFPTTLITPNHICYDLVYNPEKTRFLQEAEKNGAIIKNGYEMLLLQAEKAWEIWNS